jgi:hypothetical protein
MTPDAESIYVYVLQRCLCLAVEHKHQDEAQLRTAMGEITTLINRAFAELDAVDTKAHT